RAEGFAIVLLETLVAIDQQNAVARGDAEQREESDQRPERDAPAGERCQHSAHQRHGEGHEDQRGQTPAAEARLQQEKDTDCGRYRETEHALLSSLPLRVLTE